MKFRSLLTAAALAVSPIALATSAQADTPAVLTNEANVALGGYDAVAYFTAGAPTEGSAEFSTTYKGAEFRFASQENLDTFIAAPDSYAPQYGGHCAWAAAQGQAAPGNPNYWAVVDGRLFLNYNGDVQKNWNANQASFIAAADKAWPVVTGEEPRQPAAGSGTYQGS